MSAALAAAPTPVLPALLAEGRRQHVAVLAGLAVARTLCTVGLAWWLHAVLSQPGRWASPPSRVWLAGVALVVLLAVLRGAELPCAERLCQHYLNSWRQALAAQLHRLSAFELQRRSRGALQLRFTGDLHLLRAWLGQGLPRLLSDGPALLALLAVLGLLAPALAVAGLAVLVLVLLLVVLLFKRLGRSLLLARQCQARLAALVHDQAQAAPSIRLAGRQPRELARLRRSQRLLQQAQQAVARQRGLLRALFTAAAGALLLAAVVLLLHGQPSHPHLPAAAPAPHLLGLLGLASLAGRSLRRLALSVETLAGARLAVARARSFMAAGTTQGLLAVPTFGASPAGLHLHRASLAGRVQPLTARIGPGQAVALLGDAGSGKSSLLDLLSGHAAPSDGHIRLCAPADDGQAWRPAVLRVAVDGPWRRGSLRFNLLHDCPRQAQADALARLAEWPGAAELLQGLPQGLDTRLMDAGVNLSRGQRQALALLRAWLARPRLLLIDDAEASLPGDTAQTLATLMRQQGDSLLVYTTRLPGLAALAPVVWQIDQGRVQARPVHDARWLCNPHGLAGLNP